MEKIVIFGTGSGAKKVLKGIDYEKYKIVGVIDNNKDMHGKLFEGIIIHGPEQLNSIEFDRIMICSTAFEAIREQLIKKIKTDINKIENKFYFIKNKLINYYKDQENTNAEINEILVFLEKNNLEVFNYPFRNKYSHLNVVVEWDSEAEMYYVIHTGKRMYFKRSFNNPSAIMEYYRSICLEQDIESPHQYFTDGMEINPGDIIIDAGVAEGNFSLEIIDKASKIYLIESDEEWIEALKVTFKKYLDKVVFINKALSDVDDENNVTIDSLLEDREVDFIKMDIEGGEIKALQGAIKLLRRNRRIGLNVCAYHNNEDEFQIVEYLKKFNIDVTTSKGYMVFLEEDTYTNPNPRFVRGLVKGIRD